MADLASIGIALAVAVVLAVAFWAIGKVT